MGKGEGSCMVASHRRQKKLQIGDRGDQVPRTLRRRRIPQLTRREVYKKLQVDILLVGLY